jgi:hypothetical protein
MVRVFARFGAVMPGAINEERDDEVSLMNDRLAGICSMSRSAREGHGTPSLAAI